MGTSAKLYLAGRRSLKIVRQRRVVTQYAGRIADSEAVGRNILVDDSVGCDHGMLADLHAGTNEAVDSEEEMCIRDRL